MRSSRNVKRMHVTLLLFLSFESIIDFIGIKKGSGPPLEMLQVEDKIPRKLCYKKFSMGEIKD